MAWYFVARNEPELLHSLIDSHDVDVNALHRNDSTPLHYAAAYGQHDLAAKLIAAGARLGAKDSNGMTPLHVAASMNQVRGLWIGGDGCFGHCVVFYYYYVVVVVVAVFVVVFVVFF
jgi:hypothetical protein